MKLPVAADEIAESLEESTKMSLARKNGKGIEIATGLLDPSL